MNITNANAVSNATIRIQIIDPYVLIRKGVRALLESESGMDVVAEAGDSLASLEMAALKNPDIILLTLNSSGNPGVEVIPQLLEICSQFRIILMTTTEDRQLCSLAIQNGVLGVVSKTDTPETLIKAIRKVYAGEVWIDRSMMAHLLITNSLSRRSPKMDLEREQIKKLSERELQVIRLIGLGLKNKLIANQMGISEVTVRHHLTSIFNKLGVSDRLELLVFAHQKGLTCIQGK
jgi:DNA-binding NarL/FixJ family response regulator